MQISEMMTERLDQKRRVILFIVCLSTFWALHGCMLPQVHSTAQHQSISLKPDDLGRYGLAFITPSTVTGQEEEKQAVALSFSEVMKEERPDIRCVTLPETLSAINRMGLAEDYKRMFDDYRDTGIFHRDILHRVGAETGTRYAAQLKLAGFDQGSRGRFSAFGMRLIGTKYTTIRLLFQIWDTSDGSIAWEGIQELSYAVDAVTEKTVTLRTVVRAAAHNLIERLPKAPDEAGGQLHPAGKAPNVPPAIEPEEVNGLFSGGSGPK